MFFFFPLRFVRCTLLVCQMEMSHRIITETYTAHTTQKLANYPLTFAYKMLSISNFTLHRPTTDNFIVLLHPIHMTIDVNAISLFFFFSLLFLYYFLFLLYLNKKGFLFSVWFFCFVSLLFEWIHCRYDGCNMSIDDTIIGIRYTVAPNRNSLIETDIIAFIFDCVLCGPDSRNLLAFKNDGFIGLNCCFITYRTILSAHIAIIKVYTIHRLFGVFTALTLTAARNWQEIVTI